METKTAEEILDKIFFEYPFTTNGRNQILRAMREYASQFINPTQCYNCNGDGQVTLPSLARHPCIICNGTGKIILLPPTQNT